MMEIDEELCQLSCIKKMGNQNFRKWENIKNQYAPILDKGPIRRPIAYTYHDYTHHCFNIYKIVDKVILYNPQLREQEWFILNTAILLHDFSMTFPNFNRLVHSKQSADWLLGQMDKDTVLNSNLSQNEAEAIALIIQAHSDCKSMKNEKEEVEQYTLENEKIKDSMDCDGVHDVHVRFLAAILRIADECDVTHSRLGTANFEMLDESDEEQRRSRDHWLQLKCFKSISRERENLELTVDDTYVENNLNKRGDIERRIRKVVIKIRKQLKYVREKAILKPEYIAMFQLRKVVICSNILEDEYVKKINDENLQEEFLEVSIQILDNTLADKITAKIDGNGNVEKSLVVSGDYAVTEEHCERDWIDLRGVVVDKEIGNEIIQKIASEINTQYGDFSTPPIIVGMEDNGLILASQIASRLGYPLTYIIPKNINWEKSSLKERYVDFAPYDKIIIITDAVATFQTLGITCEEYGIMDKVCKIYTMLYRPPIDKRYFHKDTEKLMRKMTACCDKFPIEVRLRKECHAYKNGKCKALNK